MMNAITVTLMLALAGADDAAAAREAAPRADVLLVVGAAGTPEYGEQFMDWAQRWREVAEEGDAALHTIGLDPSGPGPSAAGSSEPTDRDQLAAALKTQVIEESRPLWIVLIGHGTFDGREARYNLRGPDITDAWLAEQLESCSRPIAAVLCFSSSAPFLNRLSAPGRVVISATRSGAEQNYSRLGGYLAAALGDAEADLDKDGQASLLESFLLAAKRTQQFYDDENRLATEHALLDDNGDKKGTPAEWFHGVRPVKAPKDGALDGRLARQFHLVPNADEQRAAPELLAQRDALEQQIEALRSRRETLGEAQYLDQLEPLMIELARLYSRMR